MKKFFCSIFVLVVCLTVCTKKVNAEEVTGYEITTNKYIAAECTTYAVTASGNYLTISAANSDIYLQSLNDAKGYGAISILSIAELFGEIAPGGEAVTLTIPRAKADTNLYVLEYTSSGTRLVKPSYIDWGVVTVYMYEPCAYEVFKIPYENSLSSAVSSSKKKASVSEEKKVVEEPQITISPYTGRDYMDELIIVAILGILIIIAIRISKQRRFWQAVSIVLSLLVIIVFANDDHLRIENSRIQNKIIAEQVDLSVVMASSKAEKSDELVEETEEEKLEKLIPNRLMDWKRLAIVNSDIYAWMYIQDTNINYPVLQSGKDKKNNYYINHTINGDKSDTPGSIYSQKSCNTTDFTDFNQVLYGHNLEDGSMFSDLLNYSDEQYMAEHKFIFVYTPECNMIYEIFAAYTEGEQLLSEKYSWKTDEDKLKYYDTIKEMENGVVNGDVTLSEKSQLITMSTCISGEKDKRYIVQAVRVY